MGAAAKGELGSRGSCGAYQHEQTEQASREPFDDVGAARARTVHQPSSRWSSIEAPKIRLTPVGVQAAKVTGILVESPSAKTISETKYNRNPLATPPTIINVAPPRRCMRRLNVAAT